MEQKINEYEVFANTSTALLKDTLRANARLTIENLKLNQENSDLKKQLESLQEKTIKKGSDK